MFGAGANGQEALEADGAVSGGSVAMQNERLLFTASVLIGYKVEVQVRHKELLRHDPAAGYALDRLRSARGPEQARHTHPTTSTPQLNSGLTYEGIFHTLKVDGPDLHVVLKYAKVIRDPSSTADDLQSVAEKPEVTKVISSWDLASVLARDVRLNAADLGSADAYDASFETDAAISRGRGG